MPTRREASTEIVYNHRNSLASYPKRSRFHFAVFAPTTPNILDFGLRQSLNAGRKFNPGVINIPHLRGTRTINSCHLKRDSSENQYVRGLKAWGRCDRNVIGFFICPIMVSSLPMQ